MKTVPQLRAECKRLGLPTYQIKGKRLKRADLVQLIANKIGDVYTVEPGPPKKQPFVGRVPTRRLTDDERLVHQLGKMSSTPEIDEACYRVMRGTATMGHNVILRRHEGKACQVLADAARTERGRLKWHTRYLVTTGVVQ